MSQYEIDMLIRELSESDGPTTRKHVIETQHRSLYRNKYSIFFYIYTVLFAVWILYCHTSADLIMYASMSWMTVLIIGVTLVIFIKCKKVKEGIGCILEAYVLLIFILLNTAMTGAMGSADATTQQYFHNSLAPITALLPLYFSLYYVYKAEGSLSPNNWIHKHSEDIYSEFEASSLNSLHSLHSLSSRTKNEKTGQIELNMDIPVFTYLVEKNNYKLFAKYLAHCFCLENLLFVQTVSVYFQTVIKVTKVEMSNTVKTGNSPSTDENGEMNKSKRDPKRIVRMKFKYLKDLYKEYQSKINKKSIDVTALNAESTQVLYECCKRIYDEFIAESSLNEINVSFACRHQLSFLLQDGTNLDRFKSYADFAHVFDAATAEIYRLIMSMYSYRFEQYINEE